ncbi:hypothetical protein STEG23_020924 [Scotinomys teguina]
MPGKVESLGGEVSDDIGQVTTSEGEDSLFLGDKNHAVYKALVLFICCDLLAGMLDLRQHLTGSMGTTAALEMTAATPPAKKSLAKDTAASVMLKEKEKAEDCGTGLA